MKFSKKLALLAVTAAGLVGMAGCKSNAKMPINFVAVTSSDYNAEVTFGDFSYKFQGKINQDSNKFTLVGTAVKRANGSSGGQGGPGGGPGGFGPGGNSSGPAFEGFGAGEEQQPGGDQGGQQPGGDQGGENPGGFPGGDQGGQQPGGDQGGENPGGFPGGDQGGQQPGGDQGGEQPGGFPGGDQGGEQPGGDQGGEQPGGDQGGQQGGQQGGFPGGGWGQQEEVKTLESISVDTSKTEVYIGEVISPFTCLPQGSTGDVNWTTSDDKVATVSSGSITPVGVGTVTITGTGKTDSSKTASITLTVKKEDLSQYDWSMTGSCTYEKGYGYKIVFNDESKTEVHTDFDKTEGRHEFYYRVTIGEKSEVLKFQAKDPTFKDSLAKDYKKWDERDAQYTFYAKATGNNNSVATAYMYLHKTNNEVTVNTPSGSERSLNFGMKWEMRGEQIVVKDGDTEYVADKSVNAEHPGYRLVYSGNTYYCSLNPEVKWKKMTISDFEGENIHEFVGSYTTSGPDGGTKEVNLNCVEDGKAKLYLGSSTPSFVGTWTEANNKLTINLDDKVGEFELGQDGKYSIVIRITISSFFGSSTETIALTQAK